jgi:hypothetical protein
MNNQILWVALYLISIIAANLLTAQFGPGVSIINAFLLIGLDLSSRDALHEMWRTGKWWKMGLLIGAGSIISWALNRNAGMVAMASFVAFAGAALVDTLAYHYLRRSRWMIKCNASNVLSAATDSLLFPTIAFGGFSPWITLGQFVAKVGGGFLWSLILGRLNVVASASQE